MGGVGLDWRKLGFGCVLGFGVGGFLVKGERVGLGGLEGGLGVGERLGGWKDGVGGGGV